MSMINQRGQKGSLFSRKEIFSEYKLPQTPRQPAQKKISQDKKDSNEILIRQLGLFKFNISAVLNQKHQLVQAFQKLNNLLSDVDNFVAHYNENQTNDSSELEMINRLKQADNQKEVERLFKQKQNRPRKKSNMVKEESMLSSSLLRYKQLLNQAESLKHRAQNFRLATLSNFNPNHTQPKFAKSPQKAKQQIKKYIEKIIWCSSRAMESRVRFQMKQEQERFLLESDKYQVCWQQLEYLYNPKTVEQVNFEMLNVLSDFDNQMHSYFSVLNLNQLNYKKYIGVFDCFNLIKRQTSEMNKIISNRDTTIKQLCSNPYLSQNSSIYSDFHDQKAYKSQLQLEKIEQIMKKWFSEQKIIHKNAKIYRINERIFSYYNTQTNLISFSNERHKYSTTLDQFESKIEQWQVDGDVIRRISQKCNKIQDIIKKIRFEEKGKPRINGQPLDKNIKIKTSNNVKSQNLIRIEKEIAEIQAISIPRESNLKDFRKAIVQKLYGQIDSDRQNNFVQRKYPNKLQQGQKYTRLEHSMEDINQRSSNRQSETLQSQNKIFQNILRAEDKYKKTLLLQNRQRIIQYSQYNKKLLQDPRSQTNTHFLLELARYSNTSSIYKEIVDVLEALYYQKQTKKDLPSVITTHMSNLQKLTSQNYKQDSNKNRMDRLLYCHNLDYRLLQKFFQSSQWQQHQNSLKTLKRPVFSSTIFSNKIQKPLKQVIFFINSFVKQNYDKIIENQLKIFSSSILKVNHQISKQLFVPFESFYWSLVCDKVRIFYNSEGFVLQEDIRKSKTLDQSILFTIPVLLTLIDNHKTVKIMNLDDMLMKITKRLYGQFQNMQQGQKLVSIVSLTFLLEYIRKICQSEQQIQSKQLIIVRLKHILTGQLLKLQFIKGYEIFNRQNSKSKSNISLRDQNNQVSMEKIKLVSTLIQLERYILNEDFGARIQQNRDSQVKQQNGNHIKYASTLKIIADFQRDVRALVLNLKQNKNKVISLMTLQLFFSFQLLPTQLNELLQQRNDPNFILSYLSSQLNNLQQMESLTQNQSFLKSLAENEGFMIKLVNRQNFYLKGQIIKFILMQKNQKIWTGYRMVIRKLQNLITDVLQQNSYHTTKTIRYIETNKEIRHLKDQILQLQRKIQKIIIQKDKETFNQLYT